MLEDTLAGAAVGETVAVAVASGFSPIAIGDDFFYLWDDDLSPALRTEITETTLGNNIGRNTGISLQKKVIFIPQSELVFNRTNHNSSDGMVLDFMAEPGFSYEVKYGAGLDQMDANLLIAPVSSGDATYLIRCVDPGALGTAKRFYRIVRSNVP